jgi:peptidoglycan DL-endopeptidase CwlO
MTYTDVVHQMQAIQAQLVQLGLVRPPATSGTSATAFASALDGATAAPAVAASAAPTDGSLVAANGVTGDDVVQAALAYKGVPYVLGGESKSGIDCSGLVQAAFGNLGVAVPRTVHEQKVVGERVDSLKDAKPGDLIVLHGGDHIAIYMGNDTVIHAPYPGRTVSVQKAWFDDDDITMRTRRAHRRRCAPRRRPRRRRPRPASLPRRSPARPRCSARSARTSDSPPPTGPAPPSAASSRRSA